MKSGIFGALVALVCAAPVWAGDIVVEGAYARSASPNAKSGAAFMVLRNDGAAPDRLVAARSDIAMRVELHTHVAGDGGMMKMREIEGGIPLGAGASHVMERGGDHVMFMGLTRPLEQGDTVEVTLVFETAGEVTVQIPVDLSR